MKQNQIKSIPGTINAGGLILGGVTELGATIGMDFSTQTEVAQELTDVVMACGNHEQAKQTKVTKREQLLGAIANGRSFVRVVRDVLKPVLGYEYSDRWTALGFQDSLALPESAEELNPMLQAIKLYLTNNATLEVAALNVTALNAQALFDALSTAQNGLAAQETAVATAITARDGKLELLRQRISAVIKELALRLDPLDPRWLRFGLNIPGALETPDVPEGVTAMLIGPTAASVKWEPATRAQYYRIWTKIHGSADDYLPVGSPADLDFTIENLPVNSQIDIVVTAVNNGGESAVSNVITITTPA